MVQHLIVPIDGSADSWRGFDVALRLAQRCDSDVRIVEVVRNAADTKSARSLIDAELRQRGSSDIEIAIEVLLSSGTIAEELDNVLLSHPGSVVVMSSHGRGRSAAIVGSVADDLLQKTFGPIILVGPRVEPSDFTGPIMVTVDGSQESEVALPLAAAWAIETRTTPWIINVADPSAGAPPDSDVFETNYAARLASELQKFSGHPVQFDELHGRNPERDVSEYASRHDASLIVSTSHGRGGLSRLTMGSVTSGFVRHATCPVVVVRLPHRDPAHAESRERMWAY